MTTTQTTVPASIAEEIATYAAWDRLNDGEVLRLAKIADVPFYRAMFRCEAMRRGHVAKAQTLALCDDMIDRS